MGAPKQKWTTKEENALKDGVKKHGHGRWAQILKDPQFRHALRRRSNVDLKDKWRNFNSALQIIAAAERVENPTEAVTRSDNGDGSDPKIHRASSSGSKKPKKLENLVIEAVNDLEEPAAYIKDRYGAPPDFNRLLSSKLSHLIAIGKLIEVKRKCKRAPASASLPLAFEGLNLGGGKRIASGTIATARAAAEFEIEKELAEMRKMTPQEAAVAAAKAVAEAEAAIAAAEEAARIAEEAEAVAQAHKASVEKAVKALKGAQKQKWSLPT